MEDMRNPERVLSVDEIYSKNLERARKQVPALIKRMSNTIPGDQENKLVDPEADEFNPNFSYPNLFDLDESAIQARLAVIDEALSELELVEAQGHKPSVIEVFDKEKVINGIDNLRMLQLAQRFNSECANDDKLPSKLMVLNEKMTGKVNTDLYQGIINSIYDITEIVGVNQPLAKKLSDELIELLPERAGNSRAVSLPEQEFETYRGAYKAIFEPWLKRVLPYKEGTYTPQEMADVFANSLEDMRLDKIGWKVKIDETATSLKVSMEEQLITVPSKREPLTHTEFSARLVHEFGHVTRGLNGSYISRSAEHGLPDYLDAEEGLMAYGESFITGRQQGNITYIERYLGTGLLTGTAGAKKDFKEVFSAMWRSRLLFNNQDSLKRGDDISKEDIIKAKKESLMNAKRLFRGGDGKTPGVGWTKDKAYYEGMAKLTDFLIAFANKIGVENIHLLFAAKFDPTNNLHNRSLGMLPLEMISE